MKNYKLAAKKIIKQIRGVEKQYYAVVESSPSFHEPLQILDRIYSNYNEFLNGKFANEAFEVMKTVMRCYFHLLLKYKNSDMKKAFLKYNRDFGVICAILGNKNKEYIDVYNKIIAEVTKMNSDIALLDMMLPYVTGFYLIADFEYFIKNCKGVLEKARNLIADTKYTEYLIGVSCRTYHKVAESYIEIKNYEKSTKWYKKNLEFINKNQKAIKQVFIYLADAYIYLGKCLLYQEKLDEGFNHIQTGKKIAEENNFIPSVVSAFEILGDYYSKENNKEESLTNYRNAINLYKKNEQIILEFRGPKYKKQDIQELYNKYTTLLE